MWPDSSPHTLHVTVIESPGARLFGVVRPVIPGDVRMIPPPRTPFVTNQCHARWTNVCGFQPNLTSQSGQPYSPSIMSLKQYPIDASRVANSWGVDSSSTEHTLLTSGMWWFKLSSIRRPKMKQPALRWQHISRHGESGGFYPSDFIRDRSWSNGGTPCEIWGLWHFEAPAMRRPASFKGTNTGPPSRHQPSRRFSGWDQPGGRQNNEKVHNVESTDLQTKYRGHSDRLHICWLGKVEFQFCPCL